MEVVLPVPLTPAIIITKGRSGPTISGCSSGDVDIGAFGASGKLSEQMRRRGNADIAFEQRAFELFERFVRKRPAPEHGAERTGETLTRKSQARFQSFAPGAAVRFRIAFE